MANAPTVRRPELGRSYDNRLTPSVIANTPGLANTPPFDPATDFDLVQEINNALSVLFEGTGVPQSVLNSIASKASSASVTALANKLGDLTTLTTTEKTSLVLALNELKAQVEAGGGGGGGGALPGTANTQTGTDAAAVGGNHNDVHSDTSSASGGTYNVIGEADDYGANNHIAGGNQNVIVPNVSGSHIAGGNQNRIESYNSEIHAGQGARTTADYSSATGRSRTRWEGQQAFGLDGNLKAQGSRTLIGSRTAGYSEPQLLELTSDCNRFSKRDPVAGRGGNRIWAYAGEIKLFHCRVLAVGTDLPMDPQASHGAEAVAWEIKGMWWPGSATPVRDLTVTQITATGIPGWSIGVEADSSGSYHFLKFMATSGLGGFNGQPAWWNATLDLLEYGDLQV